MKNEKKNTHKETVQESMQPELPRSVVDFTDIEEVRKAVIMSEILNKKY